MLDESVISVGLVDGYVVIIVGLVDGIVNIASSEFVKIVGLDGNVVSKLGIVVEDDDLKLVSSPSDEIKDIKEINKSRIIISFIFLGKYLDFFLVKR